ncbi:MULTISPECIES: ABC transporter permease [unclassified Nonomuraea]|uniref:ABC transporter permease n=1 Tax=unclassified Nonomuraea TaxID=2593643 RepID=UPI0033DE9C85
MTTLDIAPPAEETRRLGGAHTFWAMLARDARVVLRKQWFTFLSRVLVQPLLFMFVFSYVLPAAQLSPAAGGVSYSTIMIPGILATTMIYAGIMGVSVPLISQMSFPREIEDRLLAPIPLWALALQKITSGAIQALLAAICVFPVLYFTHAPGESPVLLVTSWPLFAAVVVSGALLSSCLGLLLGTIIDPTQFNLLFTVIMMPALMLGCVYYPWAALGNLPWLQALVLLNPIVYLSEALRAVLTPVMPHMPQWAFMLALVGGTLVTALLSIRFFRKAVSK